jgi:EAL domain-containing protein (putative c-di-GMP-specific phosphodiesterase class I)
VSLQESHSATKKVGAAAADDLTAEGLGWQLRAALPPMRLHSVSLCDASGDVLWLSEGVLGPDEHGYAQEAVAALSADTSLTGTERDLEDGRGAVFLPVRAPQGAVVGLAMILIDGKSIARGLSSKLVTPQVRTVLMRVATLLKPAPSPAPTAGNGSTPPAVIPTLAAADAQAAEITIGPEETQPLMEALRLERTQPATAEPAPAPASAPVAARPAPTLTSEEIDTILTLEITDDTAPPAEPFETPAEAAASGVRQGVAGVELALVSDTAPAAAATPPARQVAAKRGAAARAPAPAAKPPAATRPAPAAAAPAPAPARRATKAETPAPAENPVSAASQDLGLSVQQLLKLRSGGRTRRYEVLLRSRHDAERNEMPHTLVQAAAKELGESGLDEFVVTQLLTFLSTHRKVWEAEPASFSVNLSAGAVADEGFAQVVEALLARTGVAPECLGFEIPQSCCVHEPQHVERFANACDKLGCFVVLDDYTLDPRAVPLLRSRTLKLVKIDPKLTTAAMKDRVSQAMVVAISQASKVLGVHCVAKRVESQQTRQWLAAIGIDFAQGFALEGPCSLESLVSGS